MIPGRKIWFSSLVWIITPAFLMTTTLIAGAALSSVQDKLGFSPPEKKDLPGIHGMGYTVPSIHYEMVYIPPGTFLMGSPFTEKGRYEDEEQHRVTLTKGFYMGITEITQGQWKNLMGGNPADFRQCGEKCPVGQISWNDCQEFIAKLNKREKTRKYRLPTEAEWEYACRAGSSLAFANGDISQEKCGYDPNLNAIGWYCGNMGQKLHPVAKKMPNAWGLYDMHGNAWEWCQDWYGRYKPGHVIDPKGPGEGYFRVFRGGDWGFSARTCRSAFRDKYSPNLKCRFLGFRLVREAEDPEPRH